MACLGALVCPVIVARPVSVVFMRDPSIVRVRTGMHIAASVPSAAGARNCLIDGWCSVRRGLRRAARGWGARIRRIDFAQSLVETRYFGLRGAPAPRADAMRGTAREIG